ncbi:hypothetical protein [Maribacter algarum]|nr:hypothetical protein [Maribacter algarum]
MDTDKANRKSDRREFIKDFKSQSRAIKVNFEDCDIDHHEYEKEIILRKDTRYQERIIVRYSECKIKYVVLENDLPILYESPTLYMELINLRYKLYQQKETTIYIDEREEERFIFEDGKSYELDEKANPFYYFDIEFLGESVLERPKAE